MNLKNDWLGKICTFGKIFTRAKVFIVINM